MPAPGDPHMLAQLTQTLQRLQTDWAAQLQPDAIQAACDAVGYTQWRDRLLHPVVTVQVFLLQILHGNTACRHLPHLSGIRFSASAYCQARMKLPLAVLEHLLERVGQSARSTALEDGRWHGHRTFGQDNRSASITASATFGHSASPDSVTCWHIMDCNEPCRFVSSVLTIFVIATPYIPSTCRHI